MVSRETAFSPLLQAATEAFAEVGYGATTTRDIAARAGMSPAALYVHFRSKEAVLFEISRRGHERVLASSREAIRRGETPRDRLAAFARDFAGWHADNNVRARVVNYELGSLEPEHLEVVLGLRREIEEVVRQVLRDGVATGDFSITDVSMTAQSITSLGIAIARWYRHGGAWGVDEVAEHHAEMCLRMAGVV